jgi:ABC-type transport system involved in cytochrome c biogenesis permease subunit
MMDSIFRPKLAVELPTFGIDNSDVLSNAGIKVRGKRDRYSYTDIEPGREKIIELALSYEKIAERKRDPIQTQTITLAYNIRNYESILGYMSFARSGVTLTGTATQTSPDRRADISDVMLTAPVIKRKLAEDQQAGLPTNPQMQALLEQVVDLANFSKFGLFMIPPSDKSDTAWQTAGNAIWSVMQQEAKDSKTSVEDIKMLETLVRSVSPNDDLEFRKELAKVHDRFVKRAEDRGQYSRIGLEAHYYRADWFFWAMICFIIGMVTGLVMWAVGGTPRAVFSVLTALLTSAGLVLCAIAIVERCLIMHRPPVGNLYDTIVFIGTIVVFLCLLTELMTNRRFALGLAPIVGTMLIVLSRRYELGEAKDHMDPLVAVLDSKFWLSTHVITIALGYCSGLLSAVLSCAYLLMRGLGLDDGDKDMRRALTRAAYGMLCLTLFLSLVGTVLGGIWANYSWGRFWGWDPKENGALMIVLWTLAVLHARLGGYIKEWGLHLASLFTACVVVFSWWHVNFLGVGLHNYGFTSGKDSIWTFYGVIAVIMLFGVVVMFVEKYKKDASKPPPVPAFPKDL